MKTKTSTFTLFSLCIFFFGLSAFNPVLEPMERGAYNDSLEITRTIDASQNFRNFPDLAAYRNTSIQKAPPPVLGRLRRESFGRPRITRCWLNLDEMWHCRARQFNNNFKIGVYNCKCSGFHWHDGKDNFIRNNIFADNMKAQLQATRGEKHLRFSFNRSVIWFSIGSLLSNNWGKLEIQTDHNCYWDTRTKDIRFGKLSFAEWQKSGKDIHSLVANPEFADPSAFDFRMKNKSV